MSNATVVQSLTQGRGLSDAAACLAPLLDALSWRGTPRQMSEAISGQWEGLDVHDIRNTMANLNFRSWRKKSRVGGIDERLLPCLFETKRGKKLVLWRGREGNVHTYDADTRQPLKKTRKLTKGTAYFFVPADDSATGKPRRGWFKGVVRRFESMAVRLLVLTVLLNVLALATPLFIMNVYDKVIGARSEETLFYLAIGVSMAIFADAIIRLMRSSLLAYIGGRLDMIINSTVINKLMDLPLVRLEKATVGTQLARLREFEGVRNFFTGPMALGFLELPFVIIFLVAIFIIGSWLAVVPVVLILVLSMGAVIALRFARSAVTETTANSAETQTLLLEILENMRFIKDEGTEDIWMERYRARSTELALSNLRGARVNAVFQTFSQSITIIAGAVTLAVGAGLAIDGQFSVGALIACMALVWRVLSPLQALFITFTRLEEIKAGVKRMDQLMMQPTESKARTSGETVARDRQFDGRITFSRVVIRYAANQEPALAGVSFDVKPGEVVALVGPNGCGKSTVLKLIADLYQPQAGTVKIDGVDTRQLNMADLRQALGYLPQQADLFSGTIIENLTVSNPTATRIEINEACEHAGILDDVEALSHGLDTYLNEQTVRRVSTGFRKGLALARTLLSGANILLFDEPGVGLDTESDEMLKKQLVEFKGKVTTLVVTHRADYIRLADRVIALRAGRVVFDGTPKEMAEMGRRSKDAG
jgi:ATP-binding cassette, subfamily C, bacterial LapB